MSDTDDRAICPECKKVIHKKKLVTKTTMMKEILRIVGAKDQKMFYSGNWSWEQAMEVYKWVKEKAK